MTLRHFVDTSRDQKTACLIPARLVKTTCNWGQVTCKGCKQTFEYTFFMEKAAKIR